MGKNSGLLNIKNKSDSLKKDTILYNSSFDYEKFEIEDIKNELIKSEERIFTNLAMVGKATFDIAEELYKVNNKLSKRGNGTYMAWCSSLGINKDKSSILLKKYNLYLETNKREIMELPIPIIKTLTSKNNNFTTDEMLTIIESKKPAIKLKEIEERYSQVANISNCEIEEAEIIETEAMNKKDLLIKKEKLQKDNEEFRIKIEKNIDEIKNIDDMLTK